MTIKCVTTNNNIIITRNASNIYIVREDTRGYVSFLELSLAIKYVKNNYKIKEMVFY